MAQMEFYFSDSEIEELFRYISSKGGGFIPDLLYESDKYIVLDTYQELKEIQQTKTAHFFLIDDFYFMEPLVVTQNRYLKGVNYYINQRKGGPYIDFMFFRGYSEDSTIHYRRSEVSIYPRFIHANGDEEFKATDELKKYYKDVVRYIKSQSKQIVKNNKRYWIGYEVLQELKLE